MRGIRVTTLAAVIALLGSAPAAAQVEVGRFQVSAGGGWMQFAGGSAIVGSPVLSGTATYALTPRVGFGVWTDYAYSETDGSKFPPAAFQFGDSTVYVTLNQPVEVWQYGVHGQIQAGGGAMSPFAVLGVGGYTIFPDPQQNASATNFSGMVVLLGAGVNFRVGGSTGIQIAIADAFYPDWTPEKLYPARDEFQNTRFPELNPDPGELSDSAHNFRITAAVTLAPGGGL